VPVATETRQDVATIQIMSGQIMSGRFVRILSGALAALLLLVVTARADSGLGPATAESALGSLKYQCALQVMCPLGEGKYDMLKRAIAGDRVDQLLFGLALVDGRDVPRDEAAGKGWIAKAAEAGHPAAAEWIQHRLRNGEEVEVDETKVATALKRQADAGDIESMRVLAPMMMGGRGLAKDPQAGIALLRKAGEQSKDGYVAYQIAELFLIGTNGMPHDHDEAIRWYTTAASRGHIFSMETLGGLWENVPINDLVAAMRSGQPDNVFKPDIVQSYCWRLRAALMGGRLAQYELAQMLTRRSSDSRGNVIEPDLMEADVWFRLGARSASYNNTQVRAHIEPELTTAQLDKVKQRVAAWHDLNFAEMKAVPLPIPGKEGQTCPPMPQP
jgi:TPR repeat protein